MEYEEHDVDVSPLVDGGVDDGGEGVWLPGCPAQGEDHHHDQHHVKNFLLVPQNFVIPQLVRLARGDGPPQLHPHLEVGQGDDGERGQVLQEEDDHEVDLEDGQQEVAGVVLRRLVLLNAGPANTAEWLEAAVVKVENLLEGVGSAHGEGGEAASQPDQDDHQPSRLLALLLCQRFDDGLISVDTYRYQGPHRDINLEVSHWYEKGGEEA